MHWIRILAIAPNQLQTFEIWNPDETVISNRLPQMCRHIGKQFTRVHTYVISNRYGGIYMLYDMEYKGLYFTVYNIILPLCL